MISKTFSDVSNKASQMTNENQKSKKKSYSIIDNFSYILNNLTKKAELKSDEILKSPDFKFEKQTSLNKNDLVSESKVKFAFSCSFNCPESVGFKYDKSK